MAPRFFLRLQVSVTYHWTLPKDRGSDIGGTGSCRRGSPEPPVNVEYNTPLGDGQTKKGQKWRFLALRK
ncbi:hypothetical protein ACSYAY_01495 [Leptospirillum ferriphilum]